MAGSTSKPPKSAKEQRPGKLLRSISKFLSSSQSPSSSSVPANAPNGTKSKQRPGGGASASAAVPAGGGAPKPTSAPVHDTVSQDMLTRDSDEAGTTASSSIAEQQRAPLRSLSHVASSSSRRTHDDDDDSADEGSEQADEDASVRPITPRSHAPSSILSDSASASTGHATSHHTHRSYASTKPTTLLSVDSSGGANRIAVSSGDSAAGVRRPSEHHHTASDESNATPLVGFSTFAPASPQGSSSNVAAPPSPSSVQGDPPYASGSGVPRHTRAHPRNNPNPLASPADNASVVTLASSTFSPSVGRRLGGAGGGGGSIAARSIAGTIGTLPADEDASVRALAPSRRNSDESMASRASRSTWAPSYAHSVGGASSIGATGADAASRTKRGSLSTLDTDAAIAPEEPNAADEEVVDEDKATPQKEETPVPELGSRDSSGEQQPMHEQHSSSESRPSHPPRLNSKQSFASGYETDAQSFVTSQSQAD